MSWSRAFDDPIALSDGGTLYTLHDAADYIQKLPKAERDLAHWQVAVEHLIYAAERERGWVLLAWMATVQAMNGGRSSLPAPPRTKAVKSYRIIR